MAAIEPAVHLLKAPPPGCESVLSGDAIAFLTMLARRFEPTRQELRDAVAGTIGYVSPEGKRYALEPRTATLIVRPRGWHLVEKHMVVDGRPISAALFDFGLAFFHNAAALIAKGTGPYFYLPKLESHLEARLWNDGFNAAQDALGVGRGTIRATVLIETILAAFETDEILWELRNHSAGLNCGR